MPKQKYNTPEAELIEIGMGSPALVIPASQNGSIEDAVGGFDDSWD